MRVIALPARANKEQNAYNARLYDHLEDFGWIADDATIKSALRQRPDIFHVHWPQEPASKPLLVALRRSLVLLALLAITKLRGGHTVWTIHNIRSHEQRRPRFERWLMRMVVGLLDGVITLNETTLSEAAAIWPSLKKRAHSTIPHALYEDAYPARPAQDEARARFGLEGSQPVLGVLGELKPYKGLDTALSGVLSLPPGAATLLIAGRFRSADDRAYVSDLVRRGQQGGWDIILKEGRLSDDDLVAALTACDLMLFPYRSGSNSGLAILSAELGVPMLLADTPVFRELAAELGVPATRVSDSAFSGPELLEAATQARRDGHTPPSDFFLERRGQAAVARKTGEFFASLCNDGVRSGTPQRVINRHD